MEELVPGVDGIPGVRGAVRIEVGERRTSRNQGDHGKGDQSGLRADCRYVARAKQLKSDRQRSDLDSYEKACPGADQRDPEQRSDDRAGARMMPLMPPQPLRYEQSDRPGRRGDGEHLERVDSEDDQAGRNCRQQRDSGHQIIRQCGGSESCSIEQTAELDQPRSRRFGFEFAGPPGRHLGIVGKRAHLAVGLRVPGTRLG